VLASQPAEAFRSCGYYTSWDGCLYYHMNFGGGCFPYGDPLSCPAGSSRVDTLLQTDAAPARTTTTRLSRFLDTADTLVSSAATSSVRDPNGWIRTKPTATIAPIAHTRVAMYNPKLNLYKPKWNGLGNVGTGNGNSYGGGNDVNVGGGGVTSGGGTGGPTVVVPGGGNNGGGGGTTVVVPGGGEFDGQFPPPLESYRRPISRPFRFGEHTFHDPAQWALVSKCPGQRATYNGRVFMHFFALINVMGTGDAECKFVGTMLYNTDIYGNQPADVPIWDGNHNSNNNNNNNNNSSEEEKERKEEQREEKRKENQERSSSKKTRAGKSTAIDRRNNKRTN
jgi:hypothetical protein